MGMICVLRQIQNNINYLNRTYVVFKVNCKFFLVIGLEL